MDMTDKISASPEKNHINWLKFYVNKVHNRSDRKEIIIFGKDNDLYSFDVFLYNDEATTARVNWKYWHYWCSTEAEMIENLVEELSTYINNLESSEASFIEDSIDTSVQIWDILSESENKNEPDNQVKDINWFQYKLEDHSQSNKMHLSIIWKNWGVYRFVLFLETIQQRWWRVTHLVKTLEGELKWESNKKADAIQNLLEKISNYISILESADFIERSKIKDDTERVAHTKNAYTDDEWLFYMLRPKDTPYKVSNLLETIDDENQKIGAEEVKEKESKTPIEKILTTKREPKIIKIEREEWDFWQERYKWKIKSYDRYYTIKDWKKVFLWEVSLSTHKKEPWVSLTLSKWTLWKHIIFKDIPDLSLRTWADNFFYNLFEQVIKWDKSIYNLKNEMTAFMKYEDIQSKGTLSLGSFKLESWSYVERVLDETAQRNCPWWISPIPPKT